MNAKSTIMLAVLAGTAGVAVATENVMPVMGTIAELRQAGAIKAYYYNLATGERTLINQNTDVGALSRAGEEYVFNNISLEGLDGGWGALPNNSEYIAPAEITANAFVDGIIWGYATQITEPDTNGIPGNDVVLRFYDADQAKLTLSPNAALILQLTVGDINGKAASQTTAGIYYFFDLTTIGAEFELADNDGVDGLGNPIPTLSEDLPFIAAVPNSGNRLGNFTMSVQFTNNSALTGNQGAFFEGGSFSRTSEVDGAGIGGLFPFPIPGFTQGFGQDKTFDLDYDGRDNPANPTAPGTFRWTSYSYTFPSVCLISPTGNSPYLSVIGRSGAIQDPTATYYLPSEGFDFGDFLAFFGEFDTLSN